MTRPSSSSRTGNLKLQEIFGSWLHNYYNDAMACDSLEWRNQKTLRSRSDAQHSSTGARRGSPRHSLCALVTSACCEAISS